jgi:hypothetical protein
MHIRRRSPSCTTTSGNNLKAAMRGVA